MRIIFFSDAHGNIRSLRSFFRAAAQEKADMTVFGGDAVGYYYAGNEVIDLLREHSVHCLLGNHDRMFLDLLEGKRKESDLVPRYGNSYKSITHTVNPDNIDFLYTLSPSYHLECEGLKLVFVHGSVTDPLNGRIYPDTQITDETAYHGLDYVFSGHTHHRLEKPAGNALILNPGSIGQQRDGRGCTYMVFDTVTLERTYKTVSYDREALAEEVAQKEDTLRERLTEVLYRTPGKE